MSMVIKEHKWWLLFVVLLNIVLNLLFQLDAGFEDSSILYFNLLYYVLLLIFMSFLYLKDKKIWKEQEFSSLSPVQHVIAEHYKSELSLLKHEHTLLKSNYAEKDDELLAWVHEMKSPLTAMKLMLGNMKISEQRLKLEKEWLRLSLLLDQQLYTTRIATIEQDSKLESISLRKAVIEEIKSFQPWCMEKGIGFELEGIDGEVISDKKWLCFIIRQYISNAVKYSPENNVIDIQTSKDMQGHTLLKVIDYGKGIATQDLPRVFRKSYTGSTGRESTAASGMGLYLAKQAADSLGLTLYLQSDVGEGTTAVIQFPLVNEYTKLGM